MPTSRASHVLYSGYLYRGLQLPRRSCRTGILKYLLECLVREDLHCLRDAGRKLAALLDLCQPPFRDPSFAQRIGQQVCGGNRILNRQVDTDSSGRRHSVCSIAYAQQSRPIPLPQAVDLHRQQPDLLPVL